MRIEHAKTRLSEAYNNDKKMSQRSSAYTESYKGEYYNLSIDKLIPFKNQSRKHFDPESLEELASTIREHGIRQPLTILPSLEHEGKYEIVSGERRWKAAQIAGLTKVPCIILHNTDSAEEIALIENIQRKDLHPLELMQAFHGLLNSKICHSTQEIATKLGVHKSFVVEILSLSKLPSQVQLMLLNEGIKSRSVLRELLKANAEDHIKVINKFKNNIEKKRLALKRNNNTKVITVYINNGSILLKDNKIEILSYEEKMSLKDSLMKLVDSLS